MEGDSKPVGYTFRRTFASNFDCYRVGLGRFSATSHTIRAMSMNPPMKPGERYGRLRMIRRVTKGTTPKALFLCDCGVKKEMYIFHVRSGTAISCGCYRKEATRLRATTHGQKDTPEYRAWRGMFDRCSPKCKSRKNYFDRGISVCARWNKFEHFIHDMGKRPFPEASLDRIDNNGNYEPGNCRWASASQNNRNRRCNHLITVGTETLCVAAWAERLGVSDEVILERLKLGWAPERAATQAKRKSRGSKGVSRG